jgi:hypothetical protein
MSNFGFDDGGSSAVSTTGPSPASLVVSPLGMTVRRLGQMVDEHPGGRQALVGLTMGQVLHTYKEVFQPVHTAPTEPSVCEQFRERGDACIGIATWFVSYSSLDPLLDFLEALEHFFAREPLGLDTLIWCSPVSKRPFAPGEPQTPSFSQAIQRTGNLFMMLAPWNKPVTLTSSWCIYELYICLSSGGRVEFALPEAQRAQLTEDLMSKPASFLEFLANVDSESSRCFHASDRDEIFAAVPTSVGFAGLDTIVRRALQSWMVRLLQGRIDEACAAGKGEETEVCLNALGMLFWAFA